MTSASDRDLLTRLRERGARLGVDVNGVLWVRKQGVRDALTDDLAAELSARKAAIIALIQEEDAAITWRIEAMNERISANGGRVPGEMVAREGIAGTSGICRSCGEAMKTQQTRKCVFCNLAALRVPEQQLVHRD